MNTRTTITRIQCGLLVFLVLLPGMAAGAPMLDVQLLVCKNDTARLVDARVVNWTLDENPNLLHPGDYVLEILDGDNNTVYQENLSIVFFVFDYGPVDEMFVERKIPYREGMWAIRLSRGNKTLLFESLDLCNMDGECTGRETVYSCPSDCTGSESDRMCVPNRDGVCDPDCGPGVDPDCSYTRASSGIGNETGNKTLIVGKEESREAGNETSVNTTPRGETGVAWWIVGLVAVVVLVVLGLSIKREEEQ